MHIEQSIAAQICTLEMSVHVPYLKCKIMFYLVNSSELEEVGTKISKFMENNITCTTYFQFWGGGGVKVLNLVKEDVHVELHWGQSY